MAHDATLSESELKQPEVRKIGLQHIGIALQKGLDDFKAMPTHIIFLFVIYPIIGLFLIRMSFGYDVLPLVFPLAAGFALVGPLAAVGLYELSRRREQGLEIVWYNAFDVIKSPSIQAIAALGLALVAVFLAWLYAARAVYSLTLGDQTPESLNAFLSQVLTTPEGHKLIVLGCGIGFLFALVVLATSFVAFPLLVDRKVSAMTAVSTSVRAALLNPVPVALWGLVVAAALIIGSIPVFIGLALVLPFLGHSTWHFYRQVVVPESGSDE